VRPTGKPGDARAGDDRGGGHRTIGVNIRGLDAKEPTG
jgi:hypothetical protein